MCPVPPKAGIILAIHFITRSYCNMLCFFFIGYYIFIKVRQTNNLKTFYYIRSILFFFHISSYSVVVQPVVFFLTLLNSPLFSVLFLYYYYSSVVVGFFFCICALYQFCKYRHYYIIKSLVIIPQFRAVKTYFQKHVIAFLYTLLICFVVRCYLSYLFELIVCLSYALGIVTHFNLYCIIFMVQV